MIVSLPAVSHSPWSRYDTTRGSNLPLSTKVELRSGACLESTGLQGCLDRRQQLAAVPLQSANQCPAIPRSMADKTKGNIQPHNEINLHYSPYATSKISVMNPDTHNLTDTPIRASDYPPDSQSELHTGPSAKRQKIERQTPPTTMEADGSRASSPQPGRRVLETVPLEHVPPTHSVHVAVFRDVENAAFLHQQLLGRNPDFEYAFIDAGVVTSCLQVLSAVFKAITVQVAGTMKTPNVHSETVCSLSPTNNITEAYRRYGMTPTSRDIVIVKVIVTPAETATDHATSPPATTAQAVEEHLLANVQGKSVPFTDDTLSQLTDLGRVRKYYKLNGIGWLDAIKDQATKNREMDALIMGGIALRGL